MNKIILNTDIQNYINKNLSADINKFILKGSPFNKVTIRELANQIIAKNKAKDKLPTWFNTENIIYPEKISIEQTSSEITANYKSKLVTGNSIIDITGGFGIDTYYFAKHFKTVTHCEINSELSEIVKHNYDVLNIKNITTFNGDGISMLKTTDNSFDVLYTDPSRRNDAKGKVFLLKDCLPNIPENLEFLFSKSKVILLKNSPILDITATINELQFVKEIHIVAVKNEVKELLFLLEKDYTGDIFIKTINFQKNTNQVFDFVFSSKAYSIYSKPLSYLYEPNTAILKSGGFHQVSEQLNVNKLNINSHLYTSDQLLEFPGRSFEIIETLPYDKKKLNQYLPDKKANITVRNFPKTVSQIRKETKIKDGGDIYLFFTKFIDNKNGVLVCKKVHKA